MMERCPGCKRFLLAKFNSNEKRCYNDDCTTRVYNDGSTSCLRYDTDKIRRIKTCPDGKKEIMKEFLYI